MAAGSSGLGWLRPRVTVAYSPSNNLSPPLHYSLVGCLEFAEQTLRSNLKVFFLFAHQHIKLLLHLIYIYFGSAATLLLGYVCLFERMTRSIGHDRIFFLYLKPFVFILVTVKYFSFIPRTTMIHFKASLLRLKCNFK